MKKREVHYYRIRRSAFWGIVAVFVLLMGSVYFKDEIYDRWLRSGGREEISFVETESSLKNAEGCFLCGNNNQSLMDYYRKFDTIGVISLNDWYILDFRLKDYDENGEEVIQEESGTSMTSGNTGEICYMSHGSPSRGMASIDITLPDDYRLDIEFIQNNLCQGCLDKVTESLHYSKWKNEKKEVIPLCLVDFKTSEIYSLQDWYRGCSMRDYWVEIEPDENRIEVSAFYLPYGK